MKIHQCADVMITTPRDSTQNPMPSQQQDLTIKLFSREKWTSRSSASIAMAPIVLGTTNHLETWAPTRHLSTLSKHRKRRATMGTCPDSRAPGTVQALDQATAATWITTSTKIKKCMILIELGLVLSKQRKSHQSKHIMAVMEQVAPKLIKFQYHKVQTIDKSSAIRSLTTIKIPNSSKMTINHWERQKQANSKWQDIKCNSNSNNMIMGSHQDTSRRAQTNLTPQEMIRRPRNN